MKRLLLLVAMAACLQGCVGATIHTKALDGKECTGKYFALFVDKDSASINACGGKGSTAGSKTNTELIQAIVKYMMMP